ncbi:DUF6134 family protein [Nisaea nitritireducens]|uniref:DUF6134 family protein n=1 Tax=Nisaea nitritireducens TaxID=568392 RepID=UPI001D006F05|nr:DUF6134 family protein [Nisaea nitritireducens]
MRNSIFRRYRVFTALLIASWAAFSFVQEGRANAPSGWAEDGLIKFRVFRNDSPLGVVMLRFDVRNNRYTVDTQTLFDYSVGPFSLYYYALRARDEWNGAQLLTARGVVNDDGEIFRVDGKTEPDGFRFSGGEGEHLAPLDVSVPSTYWNRALVRASKLIDLQYGRLRKITMTKVGPETIESQGKRIEAVRYEMRGELDLDIWYDMRGEWAKMSFTVDDSNLEYVRIVPRPGDESRFLELDSVKDLGSEEVRNVLKDLE